MLETPQLALKRKNAAQFDRKCLAHVDASPSSALHAKLKCHYRHLLRCTVPHSVGGMPHPPVPYMQK
eukprot:scaffold238603_cov17-Tisochrysis_lutea.AAC.3